MKRITVYLLLASSMMLFYPTISAGQFSIDAQIRQRFEFRDGYQQLLPNKANPAFIISQRSRLSLGWKSELMKIKFTPQDVRIWGDEQLAGSTGVFGDFASLDLLEAYAEIKACPRLWISIGRQALVYDNQRLLASRNWNQNAIAYDALVTKFSINRWNLHIAGSWNTLVDLTAENTYLADRIKSLDFLWLNRKWKENINFSVLQIASGKTKNDTTNTLYFRHTSGFYLEYRKDRISCWIDGYYQYGKNNAGLNVSAYLAGADFTYRMGRFIPGLGLEYLSGNSNTCEHMNTDHLFDLLYGGRHRFLGFMDYFRNIPSHTRQGGISDYYVSLELKISRMISIQDFGHYFMLAQTNSMTPDENNLGFENDLVMKYTFSEWGMLELGYLYLIPSKTLKTIQKVSDTDFAQFAYVQLTLTPVLFNQKDQFKKTEIK